MKRLSLILVLLIFATCLGATPTVNSIQDQDPLAGLSLVDAKINNGSYIQRMSDGRSIILTLNSELQQFTDNLFERYQIPAGAAVVLNSRTGRVLTFSQRFENKRFAKMSDVALDPTPPAASLFKIITTAALLEEGESTLKTSVCYHGGSQSLKLHNLINSKRDDKACANLGTALGRSINAVFAKLSDRHLNRDILKRYAERFGFNRDLPFDLPTIPSIAQIPADRLERARTSAGFWHSHLSALHAAMIVQSIAQKGVMLRPYIVDKVLTQSGDIIYESVPKVISRVVKQDTARTILKAMQATVKKGTARKSFKDSKGVPLLPANISVAAKTGTLHGKKPYRAYSWFIAAAPADKPEVAIAVLIINEPKWRIKSASFAAQILRKYFKITR